MPLGSSKKLEFEALREYALRLLGRSSLSVSEMRRKLQLKAAVRSDIDGIVNQLNELKVLDDKSFAGHYAESRAGRTLVGRERVLRDLAQKRVAPGIAQQAVGAAFAEVDENAQIQAFIRRKLRTQNAAEFLKEPKNLASMYRRLRTAGFSSALSIRGLKRFSAQAASLEDMETPEEPGEESEA